MGAADQPDRVAPHLFTCDPHGMIEHLAVAGFPPGGVGILIDAPLSFRELRRHLRRFLVVRRERDRKAVYFRYYDPRVLRVFLPVGGVLICRGDPYDFRFAAAKLGHHLPVCTPGELAAFFGPVAAFHCQTEERGGVLTYSLRDEVLHTRRVTLGEFFQERYGLPLDVLTQLTAGGMKPKGLQAHA